MGPFSAPSASSQSQVRHIEIFYFFPRGSRASLIDIRDQKTGRRPRGEEKVCNGKNAENATSNSGRNVIILLSLGGQKKAFHKTGV